MTRHLCSKNKDFSPCLPGQALDFSIFSIHKYKIFLLITFFKIFRNDWAHWHFIATLVYLLPMCAQSFANILKKVINKKILYLCIENMLKSRTWPGKQGEKSLILLHKCLVTYLCHFEISLKKYFSKKFFLPQKCSLNVLSYSEVFNFFETLSTV